MSGYAAGTSVSEDRSRHEIERTLTKYGAQQFVYGWTDKPPGAVIGFRMMDRMVRFKLTLPTPDEVDRTPTGRRRRGVAAQKAVGDERRRRWRALLLVIKAKLEAVQSGISTFDEEFLAFIVLPNNQTTAEFLVPQIEAAYKQGKMPKFLLLEGSVS